MKKYDLAELYSGRPKIKYGMQKKVLLLAETDPEALYPDFDSFAGLIDSPNSILCWTGILVLGNLARVDKDDRIEAVLPALFAELNAGKMITAANTIESLVKIAEAKPGLADRVVSEILKVREYQYDTDECSNIAIGHALKNIEKVWDLLSDGVKDQVINSAKEAVGNSRPATARKAKGLLDRRRPPI
jgi:hypothetical protein